jgi:hypothetical protein
MGLGEPLPLEAVGAGRPGQRVTIEGPVAFAEPTDAQRIAIASRYLGPEGGVAYVASTKQDDGPPDDDLAITITPERWRTADFAKLG